MRETGLIFWRFTGPFHERGPRYVQLARTLLGRTKAYLQDAIGSKTWTLDDGTVIRTLGFAGRGADIVEIIPAGGPSGGPKQYYFAYLFGGKEIYGADKAQGFKFVSVSDAPSRFGPGVSLAGTTGPYYVDNSLHDKEIVLACGSGHLRVYKADPRTGMLTTMRSDTFPEPPEPSLLLDLYATQVPGKYVVLAATGEDDPAFAYHLYDTTTGAVSSSSDEPASYARGTVGRTNHHPTHKIFYRWSYVPSVAGSDSQTIVRAYSYATADASPSQVAEWAWTCANGRDGDGVAIWSATSKLVLVGRKGHLFFEAFNGMVVTRMQSDGVTPISHLLPSVTMQNVGGSQVYPGIVPDQTTQVVALPVGGGAVSPVSDDSDEFQGDPWNNHGPIKIYGAQSNSQFPWPFSLDQRNSTIFGVEFYVPELGSHLAMNTARIFTDVAIPNHFYGYPTQNLIRIGQRSVPLLDGSRVVRSFGQSSRIFNVTFLDDGDYQFFDYPKIVVEKVVEDTQSGDAHALLAYQKKASVQLAPDTFNQVTQPTASGSPGSPSYIAFHRWLGSFINALAVYEPFAIRPPPVS